MLGLDLCSKIRCKTTTASATTARRKWMSENRRIDHEFTVGPESIVKTNSSPISGITVKIFRITRAAQKDMLPETRT